MEEKEEPFSKPRDLYELKYSFLTMDRFIKKDSAVAMCLVCEKGKVSVVVLLMYE